MNIKYMNLSDDTKKALLVTVYTTLQCLPHEIMTAGLVKTALLAKGLARTNSDSKQNVDRNPTCPQKLCN